MKRATAERAGIVRSWIDHGGEVVWDPSPSLITQLVAAGQPFWLDIEDPTDEVIDRLAAALGLPPLAAEGSKQFGQRAKLHQIVADLTATEERCAALLGLHASLASKHLAVVSLRLAAVATIFLPVSFLAGFWGQNFNVLTGHIEQGWPAFLVLGVGLSAACVTATVFLLRRRNWN